MVFSSLVFIFVFLPAVFLAYYITPKSFKNVTLLVCSLVFYAWGEPVYIVLMLFSTVFDYTNGLLINRYRERGKLSKIILICSLSVNLGMLCAFKYYGFFKHIINAALNLNLNEAVMPLPLGISFYTFQSMSYIIDVYKEKVPAQKNFICFATYVSMFPQLVAGPIVRYRDVCNEIMFRKESFKMFSEGVGCFIRGLAKKVLIANNIGLLWTTVKVLPSSDMSVLSAWLGIIAFTFQIYFDFSGYSDMAIGLGKMLGFNINPNFNFPYISRSITEFWRRWHISLGSWFKEYVYIPLGGNRTTKIKNYRNLIIVWFLTGFWHGANWNFIMWGMYFGIIIIIEKKFLLSWLEAKPGFISHLYSIFAIIIGWVIFEFESLPAMLQFFKAMSGINASCLIDSRAVYYLYTNALLLLAAAIFSTPLPSKAAEILKKKFEAVNFLLIPAGYSAIMIICVAYLVNQSYNPFLYFRF